MNNKNINIVANGLAGDEKGNVLGYNDTPNGYLSPVVGKSLRNGKATYIDKNGLIKTALNNQLRIDYTNGFAEMLLENSSENLINYSNVLGLTTFVSDGTSTPYKLDNDVDGISMSVTDGTYTKQANVFTAVIGQTYTLSFYVDEIDVEEVYKDSIFIYSSVTDDSSVKISDLKVGRNEFTFTAIVASPYFLIGLGTGFSDMTGAIKFGGLQLELGVVATSLIPTNGSTETRNEDNLTNFGSSDIINSEEGMLFFEGSALVNGGVNRSIILSSDYQNAVWIQFNQTQNILKFILVANGVSILSESFTIPNQTENVKVAFKYSASTQDIYIDGVLVYSQNESLVFNKDLSFINLTAASTGYEYFQGRIRQLKHLPYNTDITTL